MLYLAGTNGLNSLNTTLAPDTHDDFYATSTFVSLDEPLGSPSTDAVMEYFYGPGATSEVAWFVIL